MPTGKYYKILGLNPDASEQEVRKRYRMMAMKFHPDRNPDPNAEEKFILLTEAYEVIMGKRVTQSSPGTPSRTKEEMRAERVKTARKRYTEQVIREHIENERYFNYLTKGRKWKTIRVGAFLGTILALLLLLDIFLPHHLEKDSVTHYSRNVGYGPSGKRISLLKTEKNDYYWVSRMTYSLYGKTRDVYIESSWIFHNPIRMISRGKVVYKYFNLHFTVYSATWLFIIIFLLPILTIQYKRKSLGFVLLYHASYFGVSAFLILFLITGERWAHLLTFGFL